jgi:fumarylpyruvate hydrolase
MHPAGNRSTGYAIPAPALTTVEVAGTDATFPVTRVYCVGRNYAEHSIEMGHDPERELPFFFMKPADAVVPPGQLPFPTQTQELHHEIELVVALAEGGRDIQVDRALDHVFGYTVGLDMTRRDLQAAAKKAGRPWDMAKGFDQSAPTGPIRAVEDIGHPTQGAIWLHINGEPRQEGDLDQQIWKVPETISYLSTLVTLRPGDLIMTGTPKGVGRVEPGDRLEGHIDGIGDLTVSYDTRVSVPT